MNVVVERAFSAVDEFAARWFVFGLAPFSVLVGIFHAPTREALLFSVVVGLALTIVWFCAVFGKRRKDKAS